MLGLISTALLLFSLFTGARRLMRGTFAVGRLITPKQDVARRAPDLAAFDDRLARRLAELEAGGGEPATVQQRRQSFGRKDG